MLDPLIRRLIDPPLHKVGHKFAQWGCRPNHLTLSGFMIGVAAVPALANQSYTAALIFILLNRMFDGLDGAVARQSGASDFGGYLDIVCDMLFYAGVVLGFGLARPENMIAALLLLTSFVGTGSSFLAFAIMAAKRGINSAARGEKAFYYSAGLVEGTETVAFFVVMCLFPASFPYLGLLFAALCVVTVIGRLALARQLFGAG